MSSSSLCMSLVYRKKDGWAVDKLFFNVPIMWNQSQLLLLPLWAELFFFQNFNSVGTLLCLQGRRRGLTLWGHCLETFNRSFVIQISTNFPSLLWRSNIAPKTILRLESFLHEWIGDLFLCPNIFTLFTRQARLGQTPPIFAQGVENGLLALS